MGSEGMFSAVNNIPRPTTACSRLGSRPLSDIREATEPTLETPPVSYSGLDLDRRRVIRLDEPTNNASSPNSSIPEPAATPGQPRRTTSKKLQRKSSRRSHSSTEPMLGPPPPNEPNMTIPNRGESHSPVRSAASRIAPVSSNSMRKVPSRTFVRPIEPYSLLEFPEIRHARVKLGVRVSSPLFMGGGTVEGKLDITIGRGSDRKKLHGKEILLGRIGVDVIGVEEVPPARKSIFLTLATELIDINHPPPATMLAPATERIPSAQFWTLMPSTSMLPFRLNLPLNVGPGPFHSNRARIRYILCATALIKEAGKQSYVRCAQEINLVSAYDPFAYMTPQAAERALVSLPSPLTVSDEHVLRRGGGSDSVKVTAGIHRQVWVSGTTIFVDVFIANNSYKKVRTLTLELVRWIGGYKHVSSAIEGRRAHSSPTGTARRSGSVQGRAFSAPRKHSVTRLLGERVSREEMNDLTQALDGSPRKTRKAASLGNREAISKERIARLSEAEDTLPSLRRAISLDPAPRIQASTSGLAFGNEEGEDNNLDLWSARAESSGDRQQSHRKLVLGRQQSEISLARKSNRAIGQEGWRNVAVEESFVFVDVGVGTKGSSGGIIGRRASSKG
ncbi:hypothetical protein FGG08_005479 [Glutinoglossum americanum]|uniref:Arrestin C-terminal-like domain-containing protein n=1 Tax=Glutinoglossum americanum TaxID=1670608 RepID=A0A9P8L1D9_9PEZI|nr:hypothetical protein FGG08_005479 [Glutinoglossum americanum]